MREHYNRCLSAWERGFAAAAWARPVSQPSSKRIAVIDHIARRILRSDGMISPLRDDPDPDLQQPPYNSGAEQALLGALLVDNRTYCEVSGFLRDEHFGEALHGRIYAAIAKLVERGEEANP